MTERSTTILKASVAGVLLTAAVVVGVSRVRSSLASGEEGAHSYFYDQSEKKLYTVPRDTLPPHDGIGGTSGDGVRAVVVAPRDRTMDPAKRRIAYLETYSPELREKLDAVLSARKAGRGSQVKGLTGVDPFVIKNTLVRRENEDVWHDMTTAEAKKIIAEWTTWRDDSGKPLVVVTP